jgi:hypothetical protein
MSLVEETFSAKPNTVTIRRRVGKLLKSVGFWIYITRSSMSRARTRFMAMSISRIIVGRGMISIITIATTLKAMAILI